MKFILFFLISFFMATQIQAETKDVIAASIGELQKGLKSNLLNETFDKQNNRYGSCRLIGPNQQDRAGRYCNNSYGILHEGYIVDASCYRSISSADQKMRSLRACRERSPVSFGACELVKPMERDRNSSYCNNNYGYSYYGYIVNATCYRSLDYTIDKMQSDSACYSKPSYGACEISHPNEPDRNNNYCNKSYGILYRGYIIDNTCYKNLDYTINKMQSLSMCRRN